jgi:hypothetical protein
MRELTHATPEPSPGSDSLAISTSATAVPEAVTPDLVQLRALMQQTRAMIRHVDNARDAALLVRRANATEKLVDETLKSCQLLEEEQFELKQDLAEAHLRTQRRAGELLLELRKHRGGRPRTTDSKAEAVVVRPPTLRELGIGIKDSHRWQRIATVPDDTFEAHITDSRRTRRDLTTSRVLAMADRLRKRDSDSRTGGADETNETTAMLTRYRAAKSYLRRVLELDPTILASTISSGQRAREFAAAEQGRRWFERFEQALRHAGNV